MKHELRACARHGHATYAPDEPSLRDRVHAVTPAGEAWRCLRCEAWVNGPPVGAGPAQDAPVVLRGRALRDAVVLRVLAVERAFRGVVLVLAAYALVRFSHAQDSLRALFDRDLPSARPLADQLGVDLDHNAITRFIRHALTVRTRTLTIFAVLLTAYAVLELVEAVGLWMLKRWAEYLTAVATAAFLPLEVHELLHKVTVVRIGALIINIAAVVYLLLAKRLFGLRGGRRAYDDERHHESLLTVWEAAGEPPTAQPDTQPAPVPG